VASSGDRSDDWSVAMSWLYQEKRSSDALGPALGDAAGPLLSGELGTFVRGDVGRVCLEPLAGCLCLCVSSLTGECDGDCIRSYCIIKNIHITLILPCFCRYRLPGTAANTIGSAILGQPTLVPNVRTRRKVVRMNLGQVLGMFVGSNDFYQLALHAKA
jgi:hypothetical protein